MIELSSLSVDLSPEEEALLTTKYLSKETLNSILSLPSISFSNFLLLLSMASQAYLPDLIYESVKRTRQHFGNTMLLYCPVYLSNECINSCIYCSFNQSLKTSRTTLSLDELEQEYRRVSQEGFRHVLLVSGESPKNVNIPYLTNSIKLAKKYFSKVSLEIFSLSNQDYATLAKAGAVNLTLYQETYDIDHYTVLHPAGPKKNYNNRLNAPSRALSNGFKHINIGVLLGLSNPLKDAAKLAKHALILKKNFWDKDFSFSFPRIHNSPPSFSKNHQVDDILMKQLISCFRLLFPTSHLVISTRENTTLRNEFTHVGITQMSASSKTNPGGYSQKKTTKQFEIQDQRTLKEVSQYLLSNNLDPVLLDWTDSLEVM